MEWIKNESGILLKNTKMESCLNDIYDADIKELGYNRHELYPGNNFSFNPVVIGYFKLLTKELVAIHRDDDIIMSRMDIQDFLSEMFELRESEEEDLLTAGIEDRDISQEYIEKACGIKAVNGSLNNGKYLFEFKDGFLSGFKNADGYSATAREFLDIKAYEEEAKDWYHNDKVKIAQEINLQASCLASIDFDILNSYNVRSKFAYPNGYCNYIAMASHYKSCDVAFKDVLNSTHGNYDVISRNSQVLEIKAYGETFIGVKQDLETNYDDNQEDVYQSSGYVYAMINASYPGLVKVGKTTREPEERAKELSGSTGVPTPFIVVYHRKFLDCNNAEQQIHKILTAKGYRVNDNREFFSAPIPTIIEIILSIEDDL